MSRTELHPSAFFNPVTRSSLRRPLLMSQTLVARASASALGSQTVRLSEGFELLSVPGDGWTVFGYGRPPPFGEGQQVEGPMVVTRQRAATIFPIRFTEGTSNAKRRAPPVTILQTQLELVTGPQLEAVGAFLGLGAFARTANDYDPKSDLFIPPLHPNGWWGPHLDPRQRFRRNAHGQRRKRCTSTKTGWFLTGQTRPLHRSPVHPLRPTSEFLT